MTVPLLDLRREHELIREEVDLAWAEALAAMHLLKGQHVAAFEREIATYLGTPDACGVASGTDALVLGLRACGLGPGDEVIIHANAFVAAVEAVRHVGAQPIIVDVDAEGLGPDPQEVEDAMTAHSAAIVVVHLYGAPLQLDAVQSIAQRQQLRLIEDGSHAHGAARGGRMVGTYGDVGCFSAGVVKNLGAYGDAGFVISADATLMAQIRILQAHGQERKNHHVTYGFNSRLDELQAAVLRVKLRHLEARNQRRRDIARYYGERFATLDLHVPQEHAGEVHVYHQYVVRTPRRDRLQQHLKTAGVETGVHYPVPLHRQRAWLECYGEYRALPHAERLAREVLSLPVFPDLTDAEVERVATAVVSFFH